MNNYLFINNLKQKNNLNRHNIVKSNNISQHTQPNKQQICTENIKFNPDVEQNYSNIELKRKLNDFTYSTNIWKPIIGSINKEQIGSEDLTLKIEQPNHTKIKLDYKILLEQRESERLIADKSAKEYAKINNLNKPIIEEITKPIEIKQEDLNNMSNIENTFIELKTSAKDIITNTDNLDIETIINSMSKLDNLMDSIKNL